MVFDSIQCYFTVNKLTTHFQHAYREGHSTSIALTEITDDWLREIDDKNIVGAAFDIIDDSLLLEKCVCYGFPPPAMWIKSYLSNRTQRVFFNGSLSNIIQVQSGIPQGSCLGPLLFSIFTNDMLLALSKASVSMYADDSTLYMSATTATEMTATLNKELQLVSEWVARNKLVLNISKTKSIVFGTNQSLNPKSQLNLIINNVEIEQVEVTKLIGVTLDCKLSWSKHIDTTVARIGRSTSIIMRCSTFLTALSTRQVLQGVVLWHLDYCSVVWSGATKTDFLKLAQNCRHSWPLDEHRKLI